MMCIVKEIFPLKSFEGQISMYIYDNNIRYFSTNK